MHLPATLRAATAQLAHFPELAQAWRLRAADPRAALSLVERAAQIFEAVPVPPLQLAVQASLAQALRATGALAREGEVWAGASRLVEAEEPALRLLALNGGASAALHRGEVAEVARLCEAAEVLLPPPGRPSAWRSTFGAHCSLSATLGMADAPGDAPSLVDALRADADARADEAGVGGEGDEGAAAAAAAEAAKEGTSLLLGDALLAAGRGDEALELWTALLPTTDDATAARSLRVVAARDRLGRAALGAGDAAAAREHFAAALELCEGASLAAATVDGGGAHPMLYCSLGRLASALTALGDITAAEGLYHNAVDRLAGGAAGRELGGPAPPPPSVPLLVPTLYGFADLLEQLVWNGKPRSDEAAALRARAAELRAGLARAGVRRAEQADGWLGLEPWYAAACEPDWLDECVAGAAAA